MAERVLAAMSGGVDSSAAVKLLMDKGYEVGGATMHLYSNEDIGVTSRTCCSLSDVEDARSAALKLGIEHHVFTLDEEFRKWVIDDFVSTYLSGGTPNPCIRCNERLKFGSFFERAMLLGYDYIATGHYVRRRFDEASGKWQLLRSGDRAKDQSYVLYMLTQEQLSRTLFPVGELTKDEIRHIAADSGLINAHKPDSQDICFIPDGDHAAFITAQAGPQPEGDIVLRDGTVLGRHRGLMRYTIGQRRGLGVSYKTPLFVTGKDMEKNLLILGTEQELYSDTLTAERVSFISGEIPDRPLSCSAQTRYHQKETRCTVCPPEGGLTRVVFDEPVRAPAPGQSVVFYEGDIVLGGGVIV